MQIDTTIHKKDKSTFLIPKIYDPEEWNGVILDKKIYNYEDYKKLPEGAPYQLIGGNLVMTPAPDVYHQEISGKLDFKLRSYIQTNDLGYLYYAPVDVMLGDKDVFQPDIFFILKENRHIIGKNKIVGPPDMVIEILSPATAYYDLRVKFRVYESSGVKEYWIVDPKIRKIEIFENRNNKYHLTAEAEGEGCISSIILDGFSVSLNEIFLPLVDDEIASAP